jgi:hypothetical protein
MLQEWAAKLAKEAWHMAKPFFHWRISQISIPLWFATGIGMALAYKFLLAYLFFVLFGGSGLLCWAASDYLAKEKQKLRSRPLRRSGEYKTRLVRYEVTKWTMTTIIVAMTGICVFLTQAEESEYDLMQMRGVLIAGNYLTPSNSCNPDLLPTDAVALLMGSKGDATWTNKFPHTVIAYGDDPVLTLDRIEDGNIAVSLKVLDKSGDLVSSIDRNEFNIANHALLTHKPRPDKSTLVVFDEEGNEALYVRYLNKKAIYVRGYMYLGSQRWNIDIPGKNMCIGGFGVDMKIGNSKSP